MAKLEKQLAKREEQLSSTEEEPSHEEEEMGVELQEIAIELKTKEKENKEWSNKLNALESQVDNDLINLNTVRQQLHLKDEVVERLQEQAGHPEKESLFCLCRFTNW